MWPGLLIAWKLGSERDRPDNEHFKRKLLAFSYLGLKIPVCHFCFLSASPHLGSENKALLLDVTTINMNIQRGEIVEGHL